MIKAAEFNPGMSLQMRLAILADSDFLLKNRNSRDVIRYTSTNAPIDHTSHEIWFRERLLILDKEPILVFISNNNVVGSTRLDLVQDSTRNYRISILLSKEYRNLGLGKKILEMTIKHAIRELKATKLEAEIHKKNEISIRLFSSLGFQENQIIMSKSDFLFFSLNLFDQEIC